MKYRKRLNPEHSLRTPKGIKETRQKVIVTHDHPKRLTRLSYWRLSFQT